MLARLVEFPTSAIRSEGTGWKVIVRVDNWDEKTHRLVKREFENMVWGKPVFGRWDQARRRCQTIFTDAGESYPVGFHILLDRPDSLPQRIWTSIGGLEVISTYLVVPVQYRGALCAGVDGGALYKDKEPHPCVVASEMFIESSSVQVTAEVSQDREAVPA